VVNRRPFAFYSSSQHLSSLAVTWATDTHREQLIDRFWLELSPREKSAVLRSPDVWCVPVAALRHTLGQLADAGADAPRREARNIVLNYARRLEHADLRQGALLPPDSMNCLRLSNPSGPISCQKT